MRSGTVALEMLGAGYASKGGQWVNEGLSMTDQIDRTG